MGGHQTLTDDVLAHDGTPNPAERWKAGHAPLRRARGLSLGGGAGVFPGEGLMDRFLLAVLLLPCLFVSLLLWYLDSMLQKRIKTPFKHRGNNQTNF